LALTLDARLVLAPKSVMFKATRLACDPSFCIADVTRRVSIDLCLNWPHLEGRWLPVRKNRENSRGHAPMKSRFLLTRAGDSCFLGLDSKGTGQQER
jgi:hypothetical protein